MVFTQYLNCNNLFQPFPNSYSSRLSIEIEVQCCLREHFVRTYQEGHDQLPLKAAPQPFFL